MILEMTASDPYWSASLPSTRFPYNLKSMEGIAFFNPGFLQPRSRKGLPTQFLQILFRDGLDQGPRLALMRYDGVWSG